MTDDRIPPQDLDAERFVLGACLLDKEALNTVTEILCPEFFYDVNNMTAFDILMDMYENNQPVDFAAFSDELKRRGEFERLGGQVFIESLKQRGVALIDVEYYAHTVKKQAMFRALIEAGNRIVDIGYSQDIDVRNVKILVEDGHISINVSYKSEEA